MTEKSYKILFDDKLLGTTNFAFGDPPMGVVFGQIMFAETHTAYDFFKQYCMDNLVEIQTDYPNDKLITTGLEMNRNNQKEPLYRKVNTKARNVHHYFGGDFSHSRHKKKETLEQIKGSMHGKKERGLDYTPLFRFLLSKVGSDWNDTFSEAKSRLDKTAPIFWLVALNKTDKRDIVGIDEASYFSGMFVDDDGILQLSNPTLAATDLKHHCTCCTHTFNGKVY